MPAAGAIEVSGTYDGGLKRFHGTGPDGTTCRYPPGDLSCE
ncbi:hypothetical protein [Streptomyces sp. NPDC058861]